MRNSRGRRWAAWALSGAVLVGVGAGVGWATTTVLSPPEDVLDATTHTYVAVTPGEVGSSITLNTVAEWTPEPVGTNQATGIVTDVAVGPGDDVGPGARLYSVNLRPVVIAQGAVPAFRSIGEGVSGPDAAQLQSMLASLGLYGGRADGEVGARTVTAIKRWQKSLGLEQTGVVELGDVIFVPTVPTRVSLDADVIARGAGLVGGEEVVRALPPSPTFRMPITESQARLMPAGTAVEITSPDGDTWTALVGDQESIAETGSITAHLVSTGDAPICGERCELVSVTGEILLTSRIVTVPTVEGLIVPSSALVTGAGGETAVIDDQGDRLRVDVIASARGMSVIEGVASGVRVRVPATDTK